MNELLSVGDEFIPLPEVERVDFEAEAGRGVVGYGRGTPAVVVLASGRRIPVRDKGAAGRLRETFKGA